jgi:hypothetical protein
MSLVAQPLIRESLPRPDARLRLGTSRLLVSPICFGITGTPECVPAAFDAGVNFFFISADLHWPLYEKVRKGLEMLLDRSPSVRDEIVVGVVSYLDQPMFQALQFHEVLDSVRGLKRVDVLIAGAVYSENNFGSRLEAIRGARSISHHGSTAIGASFHDRRSALWSINYNCLDVNFIRYNTAHTGARQDLFPFMRQDRISPIFNFKSILSVVTDERFREMGLNGAYWRPRPVDYYRFVLSNPHIDGILCSPDSEQQVVDLIDALNERPLTLQEQDYMVRLSTSATPKYFV